MFSKGLQLQLHDFPEHLGPVWFSFFLTSFSENLAVGESKYHYDYMWRKIKLFIRLRI
jgi:hypothetical protein